MITEEQLCAYEKLPSWEVNSKIVTTLVAEIRRLKTPIRRAPVGKIILMLIIFFSWFIVFFGYALYAKLTGN